jgi:DNA processing protein
MQGLVMIRGSGMTRGVDTAGHHGAIACKGWTIAAFGSSVDVMYPQENSRLAEQIVAFGGALISEFPLGTSAFPQTFPIRNRIISGMSVGVLMIEAGEYSGTRLTARRALKQNRDGFSVPGNATSEISEGEPSPQTGRQAVGNLGRCWGGGSPTASTTCADSGSHA